MSLQPAVPVAIVTYHIRDYTREIFPGAKINSRVSELTQGPTITHVISKFSRFL